MAVRTPPADELRRLMAERLTVGGAVQSEPWSTAFAQVPREAFVQDFAVRVRGQRHTYTPDAPEWLTAVYSDASLLTQVDVGGTATSSSTQPTLMAVMLEALDVQEGNRVLEIGLGTGYNCALLSHRLGPEHVFSVDVDPDLVQAAQDRLGRLGYTPTVTARDGLTGWPEHAPYDRLIATCGVGRIPPAWRTQIRTGGVIVANIGCGLARLRVDDGRAQGRFLDRLAWFMGARATPETIAPRTREYLTRLVSLEGGARQVALPMGMSSDAHAFLASLVQPGIAEFTTRDAQNQEVHYLYDPGTESWARLRLCDIRAADLEHGGPRDLWAEREPLLADWALRGRPHHSRYGLTVEEDGTHVLWLDSPENASWRLDRVGRHGHGQFG
ncbi:protein-L-isoaspartate(D-aspartate) O-methyltransferase [Streptomyces griseocarneus]|nr:protein-L-isoaspartate(D-aspartate) O-methyltransferase [Streptomyces griseocarneus]